MWSGVAEGARRVWWERNRGCLGVWRGASVEAVCSHSPHSRCWPVVCGSSTSVGSSVCGAHPEGGVGRGNVFCSPVILHNAGQIRLELTAEDIQLDCACHSVASIRVSPHAFVFARSVFLCHFHLCRPLAPDFFIIVISECYMLNIDITGACTFMIHIVHFSDAITLSDLRTHKV